MSERVTRGAAIAIPLFVLAAFGLYLASIPHLVHGGPHARCLNNLWQIGGLLLAREAGGKIDFVEGGEFFRQVMPVVRTEDLMVFHCPEGPEYTFITYRGPDSHLLKSLRPGRLGLEPDGRKLIIACDANGWDGDKPHHDDGICVLWNTGKVELIRWEEMEGYKGGPVKVGPGSPDPRFRHLVR